MFLKCWILTSLFLSLPAADVSGAGLIAQGHDLEDKGDYAGAETVLRRAIEIYRTIGEDRVEYALSLGELSGVLLQRGQYSEADALLRRAIPIADRVLSPEHPASIELTSRLACALLESGEVARALPVARKAAAIADQVLGPADVRTGNQHQTLAIVYWFDRQNSMARQELERALEIWRRSSVPDRRYLLSAQNTLVGIYFQDKDYDKAELVARALIPEAEAYFGSEHPQFGVMLSNYARVCQAQQRYEEAADLLRRAIKIEERALSPTSAVVAADLQLYAKVLRQMGDKSEAKKTDARARSLLASQRRQ